MEMSLPTVIIVVLLNIITNNLLIELFEEYYCKETKSTVGK